MNECTPQRESQVRATINDLQNRLRQISDALDTLRNRLELILSPEAPAEVATEKRPPYSTPLAEEIATMGNQAEHIAVAIEKLSGRVEL
jgi:hypothetical protein